MADLIIGHVGSIKAILWVSGMPERYTSCEISVRVKGDVEWVEVDDEVELSAKNDYVERIAYVFDDAKTAKINDGTSSPDYEFRATFAKNSWIVNNSLSTRSIQGSIPRRPERPHSVSAAKPGNSLAFCVGSCNLSVVGVGSLIAKGLTLAGGYTAVKRASQNPRLAAWPWRSASTVLYLWKLSLFASAKVLRRPYMAMSAFAFRGLTATMPTRTFLKGAITAENIDIGFPAGDDSSPVDGLPLLHSPFEQLRRIKKWGVKSPSRRRAESARCKIDLMLHIGDQIYADAPAYLPRKPTWRHFNALYRSSWFSDPYCRDFLRELPNYMILDDHEIVDQYGTYEAGKDRKARNEQESRASAALRSYDRFVHLRHPSDAECNQEYEEGNLLECDRNGVEHGPFNYRFDRDFCAFYVLDLRTERKAVSGGKDSRYALISLAQEKHFLTWVESRPNMMKFVVTSVPFLAERASKESEDKWSGRIFRLQRDAILHELFQMNNTQGPGPLVFLAGDQHCCYHMRTRVHGVAGAQREVHEIAAGPIYQLQRARQRDFDPVVRARFSHLRASDKTDQYFETELIDFQSSSNAVVVVEARVGNESKASQAVTVGWAVYPTIAAYEDPNSVKQESWQIANKPTTSASASEASDQDNVPDLSMRPLLSRRFPLHTIDEQRLT